MQYLIPFLALTVIEKTELRSLRAGAAVVLSFLWAINLGLGTRGIWFAYAIGIPVDSPTGRMASDGATSRSSHTDSGCRSRPLLRFVFDSAGADRNGCQWFEHRRTT